MDIPALRKWLAEPRPALVTAVAEGVRAHVESLRSRGIEFYGYALLPGEPYDIHSLVAVTNTQDKIKVPSGDTQYRYYRYCVDEWAYWDHDGFTAVNKLLLEANERFRSLHTSTDDDFVMDEFEVTHANALLDAIVRGLEAAKAGGIFGVSEPFLVVWISDSGHKIMVESVRRLSSDPVAREFIQEFGTADTVGTVNSGPSAQGRDQFGITVLHYAAQKPSADELKRLLGEGWSPNVRCAKDWTPLFSAVVVGNQEAAAILLDAGADVNARCDNGSMALHFATDDMARLLLERGARTDIQNEKGWAPLHSAAFWGRTETVRLLLAAGASHTMKTVDGKMPIQLAREKKRAEVVRLLEQSIKPS